MRKIALLLTLAFVTASAHAASLAVIPRIGTAGYGLDVAFGAPSLQLRVGGATGSYSRNIHEEDLDYDGKLKLNNFGAIADFYPGSGSFRLSAGVLQNSNKIDLVANGTGTYTVNGVSYPASQIGNVTGDVKFSKTSPYVGIGWGNPLGGSSRVGVTFDVGAIYQGSPKLRLQPNPTNPSLVPPSFYTNLEQERVKTQEDLKNYKYYPVVNLGLIIRF